MSVIRDLVNEINTEGTNYLVPAIEDHVGADVMAGTVKVTIVDTDEIAVVYINGEIVGILTVDFSEPCLVFEGLVRYD